jgi:hypothetical protein
MRHRHLFAGLAALLSACSADSVTSNPEPPPASAVLLKDIVIANLPSPYYHFEYDASGRITLASFASALTTYNVSYDHERISELRTNAVANPDRLVYTYDNAGRVALVKYTNVSGVVQTLVFLTYNGQQLSVLERDQRVTGGFIIDKVMSFSYYDDGNLFELKEHRPAVDGVQAETNTIERFEQYDNNIINVDGFSLIHDDFFDHLVLLPGVQLQKGNPGREVFTGDGDNFTVDYTYTFDGLHRPRLKIGDFTYLTGAKAGQHFPTLSQFSYYESN